MNLAGYVLGTSLSDANLTAPICGNARGFSGDDSIISSGTDGHHCIYGDAGNDYISGGLGGNNIIVGGSGDDTLMGGTSGDNTFYYALGDGNDTIISTVGTNTIQFGAGITRDSLNIRNNVLYIGASGSINLNLVQNATMQFQLYDGSIYNSSLNQIAASGTAKTIVNDPEDLTIVTSSPNHHDFTITFDYRYDTAGVFTQQLRDILNQCAEKWTTHITEDFPDLPAGSAVHAYNPYTGRTDTLTLSQGADDLVIFVATGTSSNSIVGQATAISTTCEALSGRTTSDGSYQPTAGTILFNAAPSYTNGLARAWYLDPTPDDLSDNPTQINGIDIADFQQVATHEIGHTLGFGCNQYDSLINSEGYFTGANAVQENGGLIETDRTGGHIQSGGIMEPGVTSYSEPTNLDLAVLQDLGYGIDYTQAAFLSVSSVFSLADTLQVQNTVNNMTISLNTAAYATITNLCGNNGSENLIGNSLNNQLWGGCGGNDTLCGGGGADTYWFGRNDGHDSISDDATNNLDTIYFYDMTLSDISTMRSNNDLIINTNTSNSSNSLTLKNWYTTSSCITHAIFGDGSRI